MAKIFKINIHIPLVIIPDINGTFMFAYKSENNNQIKIEELIKFKNLSRIIDLNIPPPKASFNHLLFPYLIYKEYQSDIKKEHSYSRIFNDVNECIHFLQQKASNSNYIIQKYIETNNIYPSVFRVFVKDSIPNIFMIVPQLDKEYFQTNKKLDNSSKKMFLFDQMEFEEFQDIKKSYIQCRKNALQYLENVSIYLYKIFDKIQFRPNGYKLVRIAFDFIQGQDKFYFIGIKGHHCQKKERVLNYLQNNIVNHQECKGLFCKDENSSFTQGLKEELKKIRKQSYLSLSGTIFYNLFAQYLEEIEDCQKNDIEELKSFGVYSPLIRINKITNADTLKASYEKINVCGFCHIIFNLYKTKIKMSKESLKLIYPQLEILNSIKKSNWTCKEFNNLITLLYPTNSIKTQALMGFVKMDLSERSKEDNSFIKANYKTLHENIKIHKSKKEELIDDNKSWERKILIKKSKMKKGLSVPNNLISNYNKRSSLISRGSLKIASTRFHEMKYKRKSDSINFHENLDLDSKTKLERLKQAYKIHLRNNDQKQSSFDFFKTLHFI